MKTRMSDRTYSVVLAGLLAALASACGDDGGGGSDTVEAGADGGGGAADDNSAEDSDDNTPSDSDDSEGPSDGDDTEEPDTSDDSDEPDTADDTGSDPSDDSDTGEDPLTDDDSDTGEDPVTDDSDSSEPSPTGDGGEDPPPASGDIDDLIAAICDWQYRCCDAGELAYRLNRPDVESCVQLFTYELHESNSEQNDYEGRAGLELLGTLAFSIDLDRVTVDEDGVSECIAQWEEQGCNEKYEPVDHCAGPSDFTVGACSLSNLFKPKLTEGEECNLLLTETAAGNDIECLPGSTCLEAGDPENPKNVSACVSRAVDGEPCNEDRDCDFNFYCAPDGSCAEKGEEGDPCTFQDEDLPKPNEEDAACKLGLSCHPLDLVCVNNCSEGYTCSVDSQCPDGMSCAPLTVGDDSTAFHVCRALGATGTARCDDDADCVENRYCSGGICAADADENDDCSTDGQCPEGSYCNDSTLVCTPFTLRGNACTRLDGTFESEECEPAAVGCIYDEGDATLKCSSAKNPIGEGCLADFDCASNMCEFATSEATEMTCIDGAEVDDDCDADTATGDAVRCRLGLVCVEGACFQQFPAGGECETDGAADATLCANASCVEEWGEFMCTDAPIPESSGGTGLICDGN